MGTLGCAQRVDVMLHHVPRSSTGGLQAYAQLLGVTSVKWDRRLDDVSSAQVVINKAKAGDECCRQLGNVLPWWFELSIFEDGELVWQGPISGDVVEDRETVTINAQDVWAYLNVRTAHVAYEHVQIQASRVAQVLVENCLNVVEPLILPYMQVTHGTPLIDRSGTTDTIVGAELKALVKLGVDIYCVGRSLIIRPETPWNLRSPFQLRESDIAGSLAVVRAGGSYATRYTVQGDGAAVAWPFTSEQAAADVPSALVERVAKADKIQDFETLRLAAVRGLDAAYPTPTVLVMPSDARLAPSAPIAVRELVPGARIDVSAESFCRPVRQAMQLARMNVVWSKDGPAVSVTLTPLSESVLEVEDANAE